MSASVSLQALNTLALPGIAATLVRLEHLGQLTTLPSATERFILGGGSNVVINGEIDAQVLHVCLRGKRLLGEDADAWYVAAAGGERWHELVMWTLDQGWPGLENLALIPGTVGAAPIQNIGAYGVELAERFHSLTAFDLKCREFRDFSAAELQFHYRDSVFKQEGWHRDGRFVITEVVLRLPKVWAPQTRYAELAAALATFPDAPQPHDIARAVIAIRQTKLPDPAQIPNAGSFFQNPVISSEQAAKLAIQHPKLPRYPQPDGKVKLAAGWLIEQCGWKGRSLGPVGMYEKQALVLVNHGGGNGEDVRQLMRAVQVDVTGRFGVALQPEPIFVGSSGS